VKHHLLPECSFKWSVMLPFLQNSFLSDVDIPKDSTVHGFPKIVMDEANCKPIDSSFSQRQQKENKIKSSMEGIPRSIGFPMAHIKDWNFIVEQMKVGPLYWAAHFSSSGDGYLCFQKKDAKQKTGILALQIKSGKHKLNLNGVVVEFLKAKPYNVDCAFVFVLAATSLPDDVPLPPTTYSNVVIGDNKTLAYQYNAGFQFTLQKTNDQSMIAVFKNWNIDPSNPLWLWRVPENCQIILLTNEGMKELLTERIFSMFCQQITPEYYTAEGLKRKISAFNSDKKSTKVPRHK